jgi:hypothetical protein
MITNFDLNVYSEESFNFTEAEHAALTADSFAGYSEWSIELEAAAWQAAKPVANVLIKKACEHQTCSHFRCERNLRVGAIAI